MGGSSFPVSEDGSAPQFSEPPLSYLEIERGHLSFFHLPLELVDVILPSLHKICVFGEAEQFCLVVRGDPMWVQCGSLVGPIVRGLPVCSLVGAERVCGGHCQGLFGSVVGHPLSFRPIFPIQVPYFDEVP